jgi:O-methyltransferase involved in polyketide biosynthesis
MNHLHIDLTGVPETLLISLGCRPVESQRSDALVKDERA